MTVIIDTDSIPYKAAYVAESQGQAVEYSYTVVDNIFFSILSQTMATDYIGIVTGTNNYRKEVVDDTYKINRLDKKVLKYLKEARLYMIKRWKCYIVNGIEADDACVTLHNKIENSILAGIDKDLLQSKGLHYNYDTSKFKRVSQDGTIKQDVKKINSTGRAKLWHQMLEGDRGDNIPGLKGYGPKAAFRLLSGRNPDEMEHIVTEEYKLIHGPVKGLLEFEKNFKLLYILTNAKIPIPRPIKNMVVVDHTGTTNNLPF